MNTKLIIEATPDGYSTKQCPHTMTVEDLLAYLQDFDGDTPVYLSFNGGYTYGALRETRIEEHDADDED